MTAVVGVLGSAADGDGDGDGSDGEEGKQAGDGGRAVRETRYFAALSTSGAQEWAARVRLDASAGKGRLSCLRCHASLVRAESRKRLSVKALCSTEFLEVTAELQIRDGVESSCGPRRKESADLETMVQIWFRYGERRTHRNDAHSSL